MALPVLLTVGALGVGWVALSRARADLPAPSDNPADEPQAQDAGVTTPSDAQAAADSPAPVPLGVHEITYTGPSQPQPMTDATPVVSAFSTGSLEQNRSLGGSDPSTLASAIEPAREVKPVATSLDPAKIYYGSSSGLTRSQVAAAYSEIGTVTGIVW